MPVKHYSSGMQMRLGFAIAIQLRPQILLLDETMSVGDAEFQTRAFNVMREFRDSGTTTLMVSHDIYGIRDFCDRVLWLHKGRVRMLDEPARVADAYLDFLISFAGGESRRLLAMRGDRMYDEPPAADSPLEITVLRVLDDGGTRATRLSRPERVTLSVSYRCTRPVSHARLCVALMCTKTKALALEKDSERDHRPLRDLGGEGEIRFSFQTGHFCTDSFTFIAAFYDPTDPKKIWTRATTDFELEGHEQPTPEDFSYLLAPCQTYEHKIGAS